MQSPFELYIFDFGFQVEDPAMRWQMSLYKEMAGKAEDAEDPEKVVKRVQEVSAVLYHIEVVSVNTNSSKHTRLRTRCRHYLVASCSFCKHSQKGFKCMFSFFLAFRQSIPLSQRKWFGTSCFPNSAAGLWWPVSG